MNLFTQSSRIIITCNKRLAPYLQMEVEELGFEVERPFSTGLELKGSLNDCIKLNLNLRCASQVLYSLKSFDCTDPQRLYDVLVDVEWENIFSKTGYFSVTSNVFNPSINNSLYANVKVKDAIVDRFRQATNIRPDSGAHLDRVVVHLFWRDEVAEIFIDSSGETLAKHGYRKIPGKAPMMEGLTTATLLATNWDKVSPFINPMCGSGTVAIEAALLATNRRPGLFRNNFSFKYINGFDEHFYEAERRRLTDQIKEVPGLIITATDNSPDAIHITKINAAAAGVDRLIKYEVCDYAATAIPEGLPGIVYLNPEYGERLGTEAALVDTYTGIGDFLKKQCKGYTGYVFTGNPELAKKIGLKAKRKIEFYTSKIDCRLLQYDLYAGTKRVEKPMPDA